MTCERLEQLLSAYLEGDLAARPRAEVEAHLAACSGCAELAALMRESAEAMAAFPEIEPGPDLLARLYAIPMEKRGRRRWLRPVFDYLNRPALQPVYAAFTVMLIAMSFVLFHPQGRGIRKQIDVQFHKGLGAVAKLYAEAGTVKGEVGAFAANVVNSVKSLDLLKDGEEQK